MLAAVVVAVVAVVAGVAACGSGDGVVAVAVVAGLLLL